MLTGATSALLEPMKAPSPIIVLIFEEAVIIAGDRARADIGAGADLGVAEIGQVVGLGALAEPRLLDLDEIADLGASRRSPRRAAAGRRGRSRRRRAIVAPSIWLKARMRAPSPTVTPGPKTTLGSIDDVAAEPRVEGEPDRLRRDQGRALGHRRGAAARAASRLRRAASSARLLTPVDLVRVGLDHRRARARRRRRA